MKTISNAREYFDEVVKYNLQQYKAQPTHLPSAFNLANALFHMHDWLWKNERSKLEKHFNKTFGDEGAFNYFICCTFQAFKYMRDVANASKHFSLKNSSTNIKRITDTHANEDDYVEAGYVEDGYVEGKGIYINDGGNSINFGDYADKVYEYWSNLIIELEI